jgi:hypothetical protein
MQAVWGLATGWTAGSKNFVFTVSIQTGAGARSTSSAMGTAGSFPGLKRQGLRIDNQPPSSIEVKNEWISTSTPPLSAFTRR